MESIKNLSFGIALLLIGAVFTLIGITGGFQLGGNYAINVHSGWARAAIIVTGALFVVVAILIELKLKNALPKFFCKQPATSEKICAESFFSTLDDQATVNFSNLTKGARRISILSRTAVNLLSQYQKTFEHLGGSGCTIRLLFIDPNCEAARYVYGNAADVYLNNVNTTSAHLKSIQAKTGMNLQVKTTKHAPTLSIIIVEKQSSGESFARIQLYFLHSCVGRDRPIFKVNNSDKWYDVFVEEFNQIWAASEDWDHSRLARNALIK